jgi:hypothetical protein
MRRLIVALAFVGVMGVGPGVPLAVAQTAVFTTSFASGPDWATFDADPGTHPQSHGSGSLGLAQNICLDAFFPPSCPPGATLYGNHSGGWTADLSAISGATWIAAPGITGQTPGADLAEFYFSRQIILSGHPVDGIVFVGADDFVDVRVNGVLVGSWGSVSDRGEGIQAQNHLKGFNVTALLKPGKNVITFHNQNGPASFAGCGQPCSFGENPMGVVFGGSLSYQRGLP